MSLVWVNGTLVDKADARVSPFDHGFLYGDGVWEPLRVFGGKPFRPGDHLDRLSAAAGLLDLAVPHTRAELLAAIEATVRANDRTEGYVRVIVSRGPGTVGPDPRKIDPQVIVIAEEYYPFPLELYGHGLHVVSAPHPVNGSNPAGRVRTLGRPDVVLAKGHALRNGCLDAVLTLDDGRLVGTTEGELFLARGGTVHHVQMTGDATAWAVFELARRVGPAEPTQDGRPADLHAADEVFLAGTACGIIGVVRLDGRDIGTGTEGPVTRRIREAYHALTRGGG